MIDLEESRFLDGVTLEYVCHFILTHSFHSYNEYRYVIVATRHNPYPNDYGCISLCITSMYNMFKHSVPMIAMNTTNSVGQILKSSRGAQQKIIFLFPI